MRIRIVAAANKQPKWILEGYGDYARRLDRRWSLELVEVALARRSKGLDTQRALDDESRRMLKHVAAEDHVVALAVAGAAWSTADLAAKLDSWSLDRSRVSLLIGGPDGLGAACLARADEQWSLSALTLPHGIVRVIVAEALYRAASLLAGHPYHRV